MTMLKSAYIIDAEELQERILNEIESLKYDYCEWQEAAPDSVNSKNCYANYIADVEVIRALLLIQGLNGIEAQMIIDYVKDSAENEIDNSDDD